MRSVKQSARGIVCPALAAALALTAACSRTTLPLPPQSVKTTVITFDNLATATYVDRQYLAQGVEFVRTPLFEGFGEARQLPLVWREVNQGVETGNGLAGIRALHFGPPDYEEQNRMWGILRVPTRRVQLRLRNMLPGSAPVRLIARDRGGTLHPIEKVIPFNQQSNTTLELKAEGPDFADFLVYAKDGVIVVDAVTIDYIP